jgi:uncharacterized protein YceK
MNLSDQLNLAVAITGGCSAVISLFVATVSYQMVKANREAVAVMKAQLDATTRPYIQVTPIVRAMSTMLMLSIKNTGGSSAINLRLSLDKNFYFNALTGDPVLLTAGRNGFSFGCRPQHIPRFRTLSPAIHGEGGVRIPRQTNCRVNDD